MNKYTHYGEEVIVQSVDIFRFFESAKENGINLEELPILEYRVFRYQKDGKEKFALILPEAEEMYTTEKIPVDLSWENLIDDCRSQERGDAPAELMTKAKLICDKAVKFAEKIDKEKHEDDLFYIPEVSPRMFRLGLIDLGFSFDDLREMNHHDVDDGFLREMGVLNE